MGDQPQRDEARDAWLKAQDIETLRIPAIDVLKDVSAVTDMIVNTIASRRESL